MSLDEHDLHLVCHSTIRIFKASIVVQRFYLVANFFEYFCFNHQSNVFTSRDDFYVLSVYEQVRDMICYCFENMDDFDHNACVCMFECIWHGRDVFFGDVTLQQLLVQRVAMYIAASDWKSCPCINRHLFRAAFATNVDLKATPLSLHHMITP